ncbi:hypothetical protein TVAG_376740 [Trichomonas vaginalis G3]|uniref:Uncharacterized protein n=1 Tax=Trichomonas vaginalis (strain ATCC PRA-98 / G3) TaxID=412133 RepID=A2FW19_TRIV3|nr:hypothetical protein TVAGG3_0623360 [Trichomonas vaginalis G3]EAX90890.1 hypothetical protein TVAG_376740 [Trichomonas vaginalis G3]KAI5504020.1 hypothetical protein TVAGG3_0623360 [Trichomonas vaginalis G3]|eukprot:XP_001303820.1 hypothetical protein [Trichomonas vaginalis G3]
MRRECNRCGIIPSVIHDSSYRDAVITTAFNIIKKMVFFIHSLRAFNKDHKGLIFTNEKDVPKAQAILEYTQ